MSADHRPTLDQPAGVAAFVDRHVGLTDGDVVVLQGQAARVTTGDVEIDVPW